MSKGSERINRGKKYREPFLDCKHSLYFPPPAAGILPAFLSLCACAVTSLRVFFLARLLGGKLGGSNKMSLCWILEGQKKTESGFVAQQTIQQGKAPGIGTANSCLAYVLVQTYAYFFIPSKDFLTFLSLGVPHSSYPKRRNSFVDTQVLVWKPETLRCPLISLQLATCFPLISSSHNRRTELWAAETVTAQAVFVCFALEAYHLLLFAQCPKKVG